LGNGLRARVLCPVLRPTPLPAVSKPSRLLLPLGRPRLTRSLSPPRRRRTHPTAAASWSDGHGGDGRSAGEAYGSGGAPPSRSVGASGVASRTPHAAARLSRGRGRRWLRRPRSPPVVVGPPPSPGRRGGQPVRRWDRGAPGQAHGPPARRGGPAPRAPASLEPRRLAPALSSPSAAQGCYRELAAAARYGLRARAQGAASASASYTCAPASGSCRRDCDREAVEPAGAHAAAARPRQVVGRVAVPAAASVVVVAETAQARPVLRVPDGGGDRGGHLRAHRLPAAAAASEAAARRAAARRCKKNFPNCPPPPVQITIINCYVVYSIPPFFMNTFTL
jgi:hypothetical protein